MQSIHETSAGVFIFLDTVLEGTLPAILRTTLRLVKQTLADVGDNDVFLFMHHPPFATGVAAMDAIGFTAKRGLQAAIHDQQHKILASILWPCASPDRRQLAGHSVQHPARDQSSSVAGFQSHGIQGSFEPPAYCVVMLGDETVVVHYTITWTTVSSSRWAIARGMIGRAKPTAFKAGRRTGPMVAGGLSSPVTSIKLAEKKALKGTS